MSRRYADLCPRRPHPAVYRLPHGLLWALSLPWVASALGPNRSRSSHGLVAPPAPHPGRPLVRYTTLWLLSSTLHRPSTSQGTAPHSRYQGIKVPDPGPATERGTPRGMPHVDAPVPVPGCPRSLRPSRWYRPPGTSSSVPALLTAACGCGPRQLAAALEATQRPPWSPKIGEQRPVDRVVMYSLWTSVDILLANSGIGPVLIFFCFNNN